MKFLRKLQPILPWAGFLMIHRSFARAQLDFSDIIKAFESWNKNLESTKHSPSALATNMKLW